MATTNASSDLALVIQRMIPAPPSLVFEAFGNPHHIGQWWGPKGFTTTTISMDFKPGGEWRFVMHEPDGTDHPNLVRYTEIVKHERLSYEHGDGEGGPTFNVQVTFGDLDTRTDLALRMICGSPEQLDGMKKFGAVEGAEQTLERLETYFSLTE